MLTDDSVTAGKSISPSVPGISPASVTGVSCDGVSYKSAAIG